LSSATANHQKLEFPNACLHWLYQGTRHIPVIKRLYPSFLKAWARLTWPEGYKVRRYMGVLYLLNYHNQIDRKIGLHGNYESDVRAHLFSEMEKRGCDVFLDIGASIGVYALQAARHGLAKEVHAFDPDPRNFAHLAFNVYLNGLSDVVTAHCAAVSSASGTLQFEMSEDEKTTHSQVVSAAQATPAMGRMILGEGTIREVKAQALDDLLPHQNKKIFFKINVQGHETDVLKGAARLLRENDCFLQLWLWPENRDRVLQHLGEMGYKVVHANQGGHYSDQGYYYLSR
jgi:FkbM family methyltransferase